MMEDRKVERKSLTALALMLRGIVNDAKAAKAEGRPGPFPAMAARIAERAERRRTFRGDGSPL